VHTYTKVNVANYFGAVVYPKVVLCYLVF